MPFRSVIDAEELAKLEKVLTGFCYDHGVEPGSAKQEAIARAIMALYNSGTRDTDELAAAVRLRFL